MTFPEVERLLDQARSRNELRGITGVLCTGRGYFVQALEGQENEVLKTYAKILTDERHCDSSLLSVGLVARRAFDKWAMAHVDGELLDAEMHTKLLKQVTLKNDLAESVRLLQMALKALRTAA